MGAPGRWNERGYPIVYCADHPSTALLEVMVHFRSIGLPKTYQLLKIEVPEPAIIEVKNLNENWKINVPETQSIWTAFTLKNDGAVLRVPSVVMPQAFNYLINPIHPDASAITISETWRYPFDSRLLV